MSSDTQSSEGESESKAALVSDEGFWRLLLGRKTLSKLSDSNKTLDSLASEFYSGRKAQIDPYYGSEQGFIESLYAADIDECESVLLTIWADKKWESKKTGVEFKFDDNIKSELDRLKNNGMYVEQLDRELVLLWSAKEVSYPVHDRDRVRSQLLTEARPVFLRKSGDDQAEVRGPQRRIDSFASTLTATGSVKRVERETTKESIIDSLSSIFDKEIDPLTLIEAKFASSRLPDNSGITLTNLEGIQRDLKSGKVQPKLVNIKTLSDLRRLVFIHEKTGKQISLKTVATESGFYFEINDSYLSKSDKQNVKDVLSDYLDISFDALYEYDAQHRSKYIIHQILSGSLEAYERYYEDICKEDQNFVEKFIEKSEEKLIECSKCDSELDETDSINSEDYSCEGCGGTTFEERTESRIEVDHQEAFDFAYKRLQELSETISSNGNYQISNLDAKTYETTHNKYIRITFNWMASSGKESDSHYFEYFLYCYGEGQLPLRINRYLLNSVLITYGGAHMSSSDDFGKIDLYSLFQSDDLDREFFDSIKKSRSKLKKRRHGRAQSAYNKLTELQKKVDDGILEEYSTEELKKEYDGKDFERDVFYLLKFIFVFTERWGREGKTETDGCLVIPDSSGDYFVASYDPKLTYDIRGYDINADEKNKAAYYLLSERSNKYIRHLKGERSLDGHIFVSDNFREGQFDTVPARVHEWFDLIDGDDQNSGSSTDLSIIFVPLVNLLSLYEIYDQHYDQLEGTTSIKRAFIQEVITQLGNSEDRRCVFDNEAIEAIEENVLRERTKQHRSRQIRDHSG